MSLTEYFRACQTSVNRGCSTGCSTTGCLVVDDPPTDDADDGDAEEEQSIPKISDEIQDVHDLWCDHTGHETELNHYVRDADQYDHAE